MIAEIKDKARECTNPSAQEEKKAVTFLIKKHLQLVGTRCDPQGHMYNNLLANTSPCSFHKSSHIHVDFPVESFHNSSHSHVDYHVEFFHI